MIRYKGFVGEYALDLETGRYHGRVVNIANVVTFVAETVEGLEAALAESIEAYLDCCALFEVDPAPDTDALPGRKP